VAIAERTMVPMDEIKITRDRFRGATGNMNDLAQSLLSFGQLQPVILDENNELIDGFRRYTAQQMNGATEIWAVHQAEVDPLLARELELETNIQREDMTPAERVRAIAEIDRLRRTANPNWSQRQTAAVAGVSQKDVSKATRLAKMMELFPELAEAKSVRQMESWAEFRANTQNRMADVAAKHIDLSDIESKIWLGDSVELIKQVPDESIDAVITDPPFGIDYDNRKAGSEAAVSSYEDSRDSYERILSMAPDLYRVIKPDGWLIWFMGISWYERAKQAFRDAGFGVDEIPIIWDRSEGRNYTARPDKYFARSYDIALHCTKGSPNIIQRNKSNIIRVRPVEGDDRETLVERPVELYAELIRRLTLQGETVADFFVGSGSCPAAAASLGRDYFGIERDPSRRAYALNKIKANTPDRKK
jgi:ParB/RepB/Spo0J family partition protein